MGGGSGKCCPLLSLIPERIDHVRRAHRLAVYAHTSLALVVTITALAREWRCKA
jgi:hypothetical protein